MSKIRGKHHELVTALMNLPPAVLNDLAPVKDAKCAALKQRQEKQLEMDTRNKFYAQHRPPQHPFENAQAQIEHSISLRKKFLRRQLLTTAVRLRRVRDPSLQRAQTSCATAELQTHKDELHATEKRFDEAVEHMKGQLEWRGRQEAMLQRMRASVQVARSAVSEVARELETQKPKPPAGADDVGKAVSPNGTVTVSSSIHRLYICMSIHVHTTHRQNIFVVKNG